MKNCILCDKILSKKNIGNAYTDSFIPLSCLLKNGDKGHRICGDCWWTKFAIEGKSHKCPGCK